MRKITLISIFGVIILFRFTSYAQIVTIPDNNFLQAVIDAGIDTNLDGQIQYAEAEAVTKLEVAGTNISDLNGIEAFVNLDTLDCSSNQLTLLDVSKNTKLELLFCSVNMLSTLDVSENTALKYLACSNNNLISIDVSGNAGLLMLDCGFNELEHLNLSANNSLKVLECYANRMDSLNLSGNTKLTTLYCSNNLLKRLDLSENKALEFLDCQFNDLSEIKLPENSLLNHLACYSNNLTHLDLTSITDLIHLDCGMNLFTTLDLSKNLSLVSVDVSQNPHLLSVCVWDTAFVSNNFYFLKDSTASWTEDCNLSTGFDDIQEDLAVEIYPNPGRSGFNLILPKSADISVFNASGIAMEHHALLRYLQFGHDYQPGVYLVRIYFPDDAKEFVMKIIKE